MWRKSKGRIIIFLRSSSKTILGHILSEGLVPFACAPNESVSYAKLLCGGQSRLNCGQLSNIKQCVVQKGAWLESLRNGIRRIPGHFPHGSFIRETVGPLVPLGMEIEQSPVNLLAVCHLMSWCLIHSSRRDECWMQLLGQDNGVFQGHASPLPDHGTCGM